MDIHKNARLTLRRREDLVEHVARGVTLKLAAANFSVTAKTVDDESQKLKVLTFEDFDYKVFKLKTLKGAYQSKSLILIYRGQKRGEGYRSYP